MKLYTYNRAPNPRRLNLFIAYKGIDLPIQQVDLAAQENYTPEFLERHPRGILPVLELEDGSMLGDAMAIAMYLEDFFPQRPLFGHDVLERSRIVSWDQYIFFDGFGAVAEALRNGNSAFATHPVPGPLELEQIPALVERGKQRLLAFCEGVDKHLDRRDYLVGSSLSWADITLLVTLDFARVIKTSVPEQCRDLRAWHERIRAEVAEFEW